MLKGHCNAANCITLLGLFLSLASCFFALRGSSELCMTLLIGSGICDLFDGVLARMIKRTDAQKEFGIQLDTVVDVVSFGVTPAVIVYAAAGASWYALFVYTFYIMCAVIRLAFFNTTTGIDSAPDHYIGLPVTYIALILPSVMLFRSAQASILCLLATGVLFILNLRIPKPRGIWYVIFPVLAVVLTFLWWFL